MSDQPLQSPGLASTSPSGDSAGLAAAALCLARQPLYWLLLAVPLAVALDWGHAGELWVFGVSGLAIIPLAGVMGRATENLAETLGAGIGGLLNATFGNAAELIIALMITVILAVLVLALVSLDGETHWMEGVMLLGVYVSMALAFYNLPAGVAG